MTPLSSSPHAGQGRHAVPATVDTSHDVMLYVESVTVSFDGFKALDDLTLYLNQGELRCIIGANGAGKTTLMDVITGKTRPQQGRVNFGQQYDVLQMSEAEIALAGIGRKFQKPTVFEQHTVYQNLLLAMADKRGIWHSLFARLTSAQSDLIAQTLETIGLQAQASRLAGTLAHGQKQWLEIGMLLISDPKLLLVDEPVAGMTAHETEKTAELLTGLAGQHTVLVVEHDMAFIRSIARQVTVLHQGQVLAEGSMAAIQADTQVRRVYLGEDFDG